MKLKRDINNENYGKWAFLPDIKMFFDGNLTDSIIVNLLNEVRWTLAKKVREKVKALVSPCHIQSIKPSLFNP